ASGPLGTDRGGPEEAGHVRERVLSAGARRRLLVGAVHHRPSRPAPGQRVAETEPGPAARVPRLEPGIAEVAAILARAAVPRPGPRSGYRGMQVAQAIRDRDRGSRAAGVCADCPGAL